MDLTPQQTHILDFPRDKRVFLRGEAGTGKTTVAITRLKKMLAAGIPAESVVVLVPQRPLAWPYTQALRKIDLPPGGRVSILTVGGLARRMDELFWPLVAESAGFIHPEIIPQFLTIETTQYFLSLIVDPMREQGYFDGISIESLRLYGQILDNLNKTAVVGFPLEEIASRLRAAWSGNQADARFFDQAQECAIRFREYCLEHSLLDFSLQLEVFSMTLWKEEIFQSYLQDRYRHLIYDNIEEDYPAAHDLIRDWLPHLDSALLILDESAGYRSFLGADPQSAATLADLTDHTFRLTELLDCPEDLKSFRKTLGENIRLDPIPSSRQPIILSDVSLCYARFIPQMLDAVVQSIENHVQNGAKPGDLVVLSPFVSDALRFSLQIRLEKKGIPLTTHRPGRELRNEPAVRCLFTLAKLAYPQWNSKVATLDFRSALMTAITGLDLVRADLLANTMLSHKAGSELLNPFSSLKMEMAERITYQMGEKYETLRSWILKSRQNAAQDLPEFFSRCFGELLSQKGFGFHSSYDMADATDRLIESAREFGAVIQPTLPGEYAGAQFMELLENGITGAQHLASWQEERPDAVLLSPAFTFLMRNQPCACQFWLDPGSVGWWERLNQPLTHPVVLSRNWPPEAKWTDAEELNYNQAKLISHTGGLLNRCTDSLEIFLVQIDEQGNEPRGALLQSINRFLRYNPGGIQQYEA
jgi:hypothetical protein